MHLKTYESLGIIPYASVDAEHIANCRFCGGNKLYINEKEGFFDCKVCGRAGNKYTYMQMLYDDCFASTTDAQYQSLSRLKGLPPEAFKNAELAYDPIRTLWYIPVRNNVGTITNLPAWDKSTNVIRNTAACRTSLGNVDRIGKSSKVYITEGPWDCMAMEHFLGLNKVTDTAVVWAPGASTFKEDWCHLFNEKEVTFLYDNDDPGQRGKDRALKILRESSRPRKIHTLRWPGGLPDKYDIRDWVIKSLGRPSRALVELGNMMEELPVRNPKEAVLDAPTTFQGVMDKIAQIIYLPEEMRIAFLLEFAVVFSNLVPGDPLWLFVIGPPGNGKTLALQSISDTELTHYESSLSPKLLVSGFKTNDGSDPSLLPKIIGKTLIIKEYTEILALPGTEQEHIFAVLRGAYDGRVERAYAHGVTRIYPEPGSEHKTCHFSILAGVTNAIHGDNRAALGERFLKYQMFPDEHDPVKQIKSAINCAINQELPEFEIRVPATSFIEHKVKGKVILPRVPEWIQERVIGLAQIVSVIRAIVPRKSGVLVYRPVAEVGTRLSKQLIKLGQCIAFTLDKQEVDEECYEVMKRVALDTCYGYNRDVVMAISKWHPEPVLKEQIMKDAILGSGTSGRCIDDLYELGAIDFTELKEGKMGRPAQMWRLSRSMEELFGKAGLIEGIPPLPEVPIEARVQVRRRGKEQLPSFMNG